MVIRADQAVYCCETNGRVLEQHFRSIMGDLYNALEHPAKSDLLLALSPGVGLVGPRIIPLTEAEFATSLVPGLAVLFTALEVADIAAQTATLQTLSLVMQVATSVFGPGGSCEACVRLKALSQENPRKKIVEAVNKRV
jgi:hypothetical protein